MHMHIQIIDRVSFRQPACFSIYPKLNIICYVICHYIITELHCIGHVQHQEKRNSADRGFSWNQCLSPTETCVFFDPPFALLTGYK